MKYFALAFSVLAWSLAVLLILAAVLLVSVGFLTERGSEQALVASLGAGVLSVVMTACGAYLHEWASRH